eukprot:scaffold13207_cov143-Cylindrotheca_fusiformis.AAC.19
MADRSSEEEEKANCKSDVQNGDDSELQEQSISSEESSGPMEMADNNVATLPETTSNEQPQRDEMMEKAETSKPAATVPGAVAHGGDRPSDHAANRKLEAATVSPVARAASRSDQVPITNGPARASSGDSKMSAARSIASSGGSSAMTFRQSLIQNSSVNEDDAFLSSDEEVAPGAMSVSVASVAESADSAVRQIPRGISAKVVSGDESLTAAELREKVRREAQEEVQRRIRDSAVFGEATVIREEDEEEEGPSNRKKFYVILAAAVVATIVVVVLAVTLTGSDDHNPPRPVNSLCRNAFGPLMNQTGGIVDGNIRPQTETDIFPCQVGGDEDDGFGLWYFLDGTGKRLSASTCVGTELDTQVLVFSGSCDNLVCVGGGDQLCGDASAVGWLALEATRYYILVRGFRASVGKFTLVIDELSDNGSCDKSELIDAGESPVFGSTRNLPSNESTAQCNSTPVVAPGSWYHVKGDGSSKCAFANSDDPTSVSYQLELSLFSGSCADPTCVDSKPGKNISSAHRTEHLVWKAEAGLEYFLRVNGAEVNAVGDFFLHLLSPPPNVVCDEALQIEPGGNSVSGTTVDSCQVVPVLCPKASQSRDMVGVWFVVNGASSGQLTAFADFEVETNCVSPRGAFAQISIYRGAANSCSELSCVDFADYCNPDQNETVSQWLADPGETYYLHVQVSMSSAFSLRLEETALEVPDRCEDAIAVSTDESVLASTVNANINDLGECSSISAEIPTVFFSVNGTGSDMTASLCNEGTNFAAGMTIISGDCQNLSCVNSNVLTCDGLRSVATWSSVVGQNYYIAVHGLNSADQSGRFNLTVSNRGIDVENDFCATAEDVLIPSVTNGSTTDAIVDNNRLCGGGRTNPESPGIWYSIVGNGSTLTASLCNDGTDFDTFVQVLSGSCDALVCVASNDDFESEACDNKSVVSWNATQDETYYILVTGFTVSDFGSVVLNVTMEEEV